MQDFDFRDIAEGALAGTGALWPVTMGIVIGFGPDDPTEAHTLYSNATPARVLPVLKAVVARLEAGELRMPVDGGDQWVAEDGADGR